MSIVDSGLRALFAKSPAARPSPAAAHDETQLTAQECRSSIGLMRVNRAGEVSAQALYLGQSLFARSSETRQHLLRAAAEEADHLAWCSQRLEQLGGRRSLLDPLWYAGSVAVGMLAATAGDRRSLGFVAETERQVEAHLEDHLARLPLADEKSRAILTLMAADESHHGTMAELAGGTPLPRPARLAMSICGNILRRTALLL
jgi:ubiquinone biosynthesis monooxygenase Coq7